MNKGIRLLKRLMALFLVLIFCIESFGAVVSDNDGSAFITKAEFDSLKNNFQSQIDQYNTSIDSKIDGAIASYLAGIKVDSFKNEKTIVEDAIDDYVYCYDVNKPLDYKYGWPIFWGDFLQEMYTGHNEGYQEVGIKVAFGRPGTVADNQKQNKTVITNLKKDKNNNWYAYWYGYCENCVDTLYFVVSELSKSVGGNAWCDKYRGLIATCQDTPYSSGLYLKTDTPLIGDYLWRIRSVSGAYMTAAPGFGCWAGSNGTHIMSPFFAPAYCRGIDHDWGNRKQTTIVINKQYNYDMFSNFDRDYNWGYYGDYADNFIPGFAKRNKQVWTYVTDGGGDYNKTDNPNILVYCATGAISSYVYSMDWINVTTRNNTAAVSNTIGLADYTNTHVRENATFLFPLIGFERTYLTNWGQIVSPSTSLIANTEYKLHGNSAGMYPGTDNNYYLSVCAGLPVANLERNQSLAKLSLEFAETGSHVVWFSDRPFTPNLDPQNNTNLIENMVGGTYNNTLKGYVVTGNTVSFSWDRENTDEGTIVYMKWAKLTGTSTTEAKSGVKLGDKYSIKESG